MILCFGFIIAILRDFFRAGSIEKLNKSNKLTKRKRLKKLDAKKKKIVNADKIPEEIRN